jgi:uncharacterized phage protein gp47/JayE
MAEIRRYEDIMQQATANMIAQQDKITDFNLGSIIHTFLDTIARIAERIYVAIRQGYNENLRLVPYSIFKFRRKLGRKASGTVVFSRAMPLPARTIIVSGTKVSYENKDYITTEVGFIEAGDVNSNPIKILAADIGVSFNIPSGVIDSIKTAVPEDVVTVTNNVAVTGGTDIESDAEFDERFKIFINGLSGTNIYAIMSAALELDIVRSVSVQEHKPLLRNIFNLTVYVDDGSGTAPEETIATVKLAIEGDGTAEHQGHLAPGVNIRILPPQTVPVNFSIIAYAYRADIQGVETEVRRIVTEYINSLRIGKPVILSEVVARIKALPYVRDVQIVSPVENIVIGTDQIPRSGISEIEIREVANG